METKVIPVKRNLRFYLQPEKIGNWSGKGPHLSLLLNTFSLLFPEGERYFIQSVRNFEDKITNKDLKEAIVSFIAQEAFHGREHISYNKALAKAGYPTELFEPIFTRFLKLSQRTISKEAQLGITCALEHLTAVMAQSLLLNQEEFNLDSDPRFAAMWKWHALEETEHKAVAYDVYCEIMGHSPNAYALRVMTFIIANIMFFGFAMPFYLAFIIKDGQQFNISSIISSIQTLWGDKPGAFRKAIPDWLSYFRPNFHPWDLDNSHYLTEFENLMTQIENFSPIR